MPAARTQAGQIRYEVEWCSHIPLDEDGNSDWDGAVFNVHHVKREEDARAFAHRLLQGKAHWGGKLVPAPVIGVCNVTRQVRQIDSDLLAHEGLSRFEWADVGETPELRADDDWSEPLVFESVVTH